MLDLDSLSVNSLRVLACQMIEQANSGHPGIALGASPAVYALYAHHLSVSCKQPNHFLRDRFVLSAGHGSAMLYAALHLFGFPLSMGDLKQFRQLGSACPGHPERRFEVGIEATTGPLGQGVANAVGMAIAERYFAARFNKPDAELFDNYTYVLAGDGCLMEGVANEALSLAGTLELNKLIVLYDSNHITIDGRTEQTFTQDTKKVFEGYGFLVLEVDNANDLMQIDAALSQAKQSEKPVLIINHTIIGFGSVLAGTEKVHGAPLGAERLQNLQTALGINTKPFEILPEVTKHFANLQKRYESVELIWKQKTEHYQKKYPAEWRQLQNWLSLNFSDAETVLQPINLSTPHISTRELGAMALAQLGQRYENIIGGAADLTSSTKTILKDTGKFSKENWSGRNIMFGIREFAMAAISNGLALYGGLKPFCSTFFVFSDYLKGALRLSALSNLPTLYIFTHDSIGVGEDGPTHQAVEQLTALRATPNLCVYRPANRDEVKAGYVLAMQNSQPTALILTRQAVLNQSSSYKDALKGGYIFSKETHPLQLVLLSSGSEVEIALDAQQQLEQKGIGTRVVSMPSMDLFNKQSKAYRQKVLPENCVKRISIEAGATGLWYQYVGLQGIALGIDEFGKSGKLQSLYEHFNLTPKFLVKQALQLCK